jgi:hypothetical protein
MHAVVDALGPRFITASHAGLEVHDTRIRRDALQLDKSISPDVRERHRPRDGAVDLLGKLHVRAGFCDARFIDLWVARIGQDLIDAASGHDVSAKEDGKESF